MADQQLIEKYFESLKAHVCRPQEIHSTNIMEISQECLNKDIGPQVLAHIHQDATRRLLKDFPDLNPLDIANRAFMPFIEASFVLHKTHSKCLRAAEQNLALLESQKKYQIILENIEEGYYELDFLGNFTFVNASICNILKLSKKELLKSNIGQFMDKNLKEGIQKSLMNKPLGGVSIKDWRLKTDNGKERLLQASIYTIRNPEDRTVGYRGLVQDVSKRVQLRDELKEALAIKNQLIAAVSSFLIGLNNQDLIVYWNAVSEKVFDIPAYSVIDHSLDQCPIQWDWEQIKQGILECRDSSSTIHLEINFRRANEKSGLLGVNISPVKVIKNEKSGILIMGTDITDRKLMERQLAQAQRLESIGQLAAGIAHEINTPTQYVGDNTRFLQNAFDDLLRILKKYDGMLQAVKDGHITNNLIKELENSIEEGELEYLEEEIPLAIKQCLEGVDRITNIVRSMKEFSHPGTEEMTALDINKAIENTVTVTRNEWKYVAEMILNLDPCLPLVFCYPGRIKQAILNIIINASHAISDLVGDGSEHKGKITISTHKQGEEVEIRIDDTGTGIPEEYQSKIFDPFFTTKEVGKGTGQGLSICHSVIVEKHGGSIRFETNAGTGTSFIIGLPIKNDNKLKDEEK